MRICVMTAVLTALTSAPGWRGDCGELAQGAVRSWGQPAFGLRISISVDKAPSVKGGPLLVSAVVENVSETKVDFQAVAAFDLRNSPKPSPESTAAFGRFWCPVNLPDRPSPGKTGLILASPSRIVVEKGSSISTTFDLVRHGWDNSFSSWWPAREFDSVVTPGEYILRLDIQVGGEVPKWIRSNEVKIVIGKRAAYQPSILPSRNQASTRDQAPVGKRGTLPGFAGLEEQVTTGNDD